MKISSGFNIYNQDYKDFIKENKVGYLNGPKIDAVVSDPPYDMSKNEIESNIFGLADGNTILFCDPRNQWGSSPTEYLFWYKMPSTKNFSRNCGKFVEMILVYRKSTSPFNQLHWSQMTGIYDDRLIYPPKHPFEKPLSLIERLIMIYTNPGDTVFDPFMGSGTVGIACHNLGRKYIGCEIEKGYYDLAMTNIYRAINDISIIPSRS